jgi:hypothetical protein
MREWDLIKQLCPRLYKHGMYFECGSGWYDIVHDLSIKIERLLEKDAEQYSVPEGEEDQHVQMYAVQVKEKYGTLRFYMSCETDEISNLIRDCERLSEKTCEKCGAPGTYRGVSWVEVRCDECYVEKR